MKNILAIVLLLFAITSFAQEIKKDTIKEHSPRKAATFSAILPGLGQAYNKKYWKIPIFYGIGGFTLYSALQQNKKYKVFNEATDLAREELDYSHLNTQLEGYGVTNSSFFEKNRDNARTSRDLFFVYTGVVYFLNIVDALVDGHLKGFNVSKDLSISPYINQLYFAKGVTIKLSI